jgi:hypothetical protein
MSKRTKSIKHSRREFLLKGMVAVGGAATLSAVGKVGAAEKPDDKPADITSTQKVTGYRETAHIREYYERAKF